MVETASSLDEVLAQFMQAVDTSIGGLTEKGEELERKANRKVIGGTTRRDGGRLVADVEYDDGTTRSLSAVREQGQLRIVPEADQEPDPGV